MFSRFFIFSLVILLSAGCVNDRFLGKSDRDSKKSIKSSNKMRPYKINGKWYYPKKRIVGEKIEGIVSWYGEDFHGKPTANGETFNMFDLTTAHRTLPMNTMLLVKNIENGKSVVVRVNDRGPFVKGKELDLSKKAGMKIGIIKRGAVKAEITILGYNGMIDESLLEKKTSQNRKVVKNMNSKEKNDKSKIEQSPIFIKNTFHGTNIIENPIYISKQTPQPIEQNSSKKIVETLESNSSIVKKTPVLENNLEIIDENSSKEIEENLSIKLSKSDAVEQPDDWVEEITDLVIQPQNQSEEVHIEPVYKRNYYVQVASFKFLTGAENFVTENKDLLPSNLKLVTRKEKQLFRIWVSGFKDVYEARAFNDKKEFFSSSFLVYRDEVESK